VGDQLETSAVAKVSYADFTFNLIAGMHSSGRQEVWFSLAFCVLAYESTHDGQCVHYRCFGLTLGLECGLSLITLVKIEM
jgi:hypothetical protein